MASGQAKHPDFIWDTIGPKSVPHSPPTHLSPKVFVFHLSRYFNYKKLHIETWDSIFLQKVSICAHTHLRGIIGAGVKDAFSGLLKPPLSHSVCVCS